MFKKFHISLAIVIILILAQGCGYKLDLGDFDKHAWLEDVNGCSNIRNTMLDDIEEIKPKLLGLYQKAIIKVLGLPEEQELYKRSQTYYIYWIDPSEDCQSTFKDPRKLEIRFTSLGIANEINIR